VTQPLTLDAIDAALVDLPGVRRAAIGHLQLRLRAPSFPDAVRLISLVAATAEELNHHPDIDLRWRSVTFTLSTHSAGGVTDKDLDLARRILQHGDEVGAERVGPPDRVEVAIDAADPAAVRPFWQAALGYVEQDTGTDGTELHHPDGAGPVVWFQPMDPARTGRNRIHLDVYLGPEEAEKRVAAALAAGGRLVTDEHAPRWWVLADAEGNEVCICT